MAQDLGFQVNARIEWKTKVPSSATPFFKSPTFSLLGSEWYLDFSKYTGNESLFFRSRYVAHLNPTKSEDALMKTPFEVETYIRHPTDDSTAPSGWKWRRITKKEKVRIWSAEFTLNGPLREPDWLRELGKVRLVCLVYDPSGKDPDIAETSITGSMESSAAEPSDLECLSRDLGRLLEDGHLPDVSLNCGGRIFPAHRSILAARSQVLRNKMAESETVDVKDFHPDVIRHFLQYLYTGKLTAMSEGAVASLYGIADRYGVDSLKRACTRWIVGGLTEGNCIKYLTVIELHGIVPLKKVVVTFICGHPAVMLGEEWAELTKRHPGLSFEVHQSFVRLKAEA